MEVLSEQVANFVRATQGNYRAPPYKGPMGSWARSIYICIPLPQVPGHGPAARARRRDLGPGPVPGLWPGNFVKEVRIYIYIYIYSQIYRYIKAYSALVDGVAIASLLFLLHEKSGERAAAERLGPVIIFNPSCLYGVTCYL